MGNFVKKLSDGGLAEDARAFMESELDEDTNKERMVSLDKACEWIEKNFRSDGCFSLYYLGGGIYTPKKIAKDFRKAMEKE